MPQLVLQILVSKRAEKTTSSKWRKLPANVNFFSWVSKSEDHTDSWNFARILSSGSEFSRLLTLEYDQRFHRTQLNPLARTFFCCSEIFNVHTKSWVQSTNHVPRRKRWLQGKCSLLPTPLLGALGSFSELGLRDESLEILSFENSEKWRFYHEADLEETRKSPEWLDSDVKSSDDRIRTRISSR